MQRVRLQKLLLKVATPFVYWVSPLRILPIGYRLIFATLSFWPSFFQRYITYIKINKRVGLFNITNLSYAVIEFGANVFKWNYNLKLYVLVILSSIIKVVLLNSYHSQTDFEVFFAISVLFYIYTRFVVFEWDISIPIMRIYLILWDYIGSFCIVSFDVF